mmetsp:Transcript_51913/g.43591  ORF Transcript_51913/g.43591 Transcript_51913/m.43591 type:complete len:85 (-) Transcript_51913:285-539(-)
MLVTYSAPFGKRHGHALVTYENKIFLVGGFNGIKVLNDIWASSDGRYWTLITEFAPFDPRHGHAMVSNKGKLFLIGGDNKNSQV